jgi:transposase
VTDTLGLIHYLHVTPANEQDRDVAEDLLTAILSLPDPPAVIYADSAYAGRLERLVEEMGARLEIVRRRPGTRGFEVLPKRWIVERTFGWTVLNRRLRCAYDALGETRETWYYLAHTRLLSARLTQCPTR